MRLLGTAVAILIWGSATLGQGSIGGGTTTQGRDDHDDNAPLQSGYAIVTPANPGSGPLKVSEAYGLKSGLDTAQTGLWVADLTTDATLYADVSARLGRDLGVAIVNPGATSATLTLTLRRGDGTLLVAKGVSIPAHNQTVQFLTSLIPVHVSGGNFGTESPLTTEYRGTLNIASNVPISILGIRFRGPSFSAEIPDSIPSSVGFPQFQQGIGGAGSLLVPQFVSGGGWATQIVVRNPTSATVVFRLDLFTKTGQPMSAALNGQTGSSFANVSIPPGGVVVFAPRDANGDDRF